ncbi:hypothetical protein [Corynebacterium sp. A21]|uniref:hypothetical protein n=1 Tax=Corynebacterium sp. A21 TaxID=3457318 RepID=UPI003FD0249F
MRLLEMFSRKQDTLGLIPRGLQNTVLQETTEANGFPVGAVVNTHRNQATIGIGVETEELIPETQWQTFEDEIVHMAGLLCTVTVDESCGGRQRSRAGVTLRATDKAQRKDVSEMMTSLAQRASDLHTAASVSGIDATLLSAEDIATITATAWTPDPVPRVDQWPALGSGLVMETTSLLEVAGRHSITWEVELSDPATSAEISEALHAIQMGPTILRWARVFRPVAVAEAEGSAATGEGRHSGILTLVVDDTDQELTAESADQITEALARRVLNVLSARTRLRVRRAIGRQQIMTTAGLGLGVLGWQNLEIQR